MNESTIYKKLYDFFKPEILKVVNDSDHDQLTYLRVFDRGGWRQ